MRPENSGQKVGSSRRNPWGVLPGVRAVMIFSKPKTGAAVVICSRVTFWMVPWVDHVRPHFSAVYGRCFTHITIILASQSRLEVRRDDVGQVYLKGHHCISKADGGLVTELGVGHAECRGHGLGVHAHGVWVEVSRDIVALEHQLGGAKADAVGFL